MDLDVAFMLDQLPARCQEKTIWKKPAFDFAPLGVGGYNHASAFPWKRTRSSFVVQSSEKHNDLALIGRPQKEKRASTFVLTR
jgi:hypothetical protein